MLRRKRDRLGVSFAKQKMMRRFLDRLRRFGPRPPASVWARPRSSSRHILTALKDIKTRIKSVLFKLMGNIISSLSHAAPLFSESSPLSVSDSFLDTPRRTPAARAQAFRIGFPWAPASPGCYEPSAWNCPCSSSRRTFLVPVPWVSACL